MIRSACSERRLPAIINLHDVQLAQQFADRIVGLRAGEIVFDGPPDQLDAATLTEIYGEEDWHATLQSSREEHGGDDAATEVLSHARSLEERIDA
jgi:phosphonate transport system ATP-binding protein